MFGIYEYHRQVRKICTLVLVIVDYVLPVYPHTNEAGTLSYQYWSFNNAVLYSLVQYLNKVESRLFVVVGGPFPFNEFKKHQLKGNGRYMRNEFKNQRDHDKTTKFHACIKTILL